MVQTKNKIMFVIWRAHGLVFQQGEAGEFTWSFYVFIFPSWLTLPLISVTVKINQLNLWMAQVWCWFGDLFWFYILTLTPEWKGCSPGWISWCWCSLPTCLSSLIYFESMFVTVLSLTHCSTLTNFLISSLSSLLCVRVPVSGNEGKTNKCGMLSMLMLA